MKTLNLKLLPFLLILVFLGSCTEFFSTSWASWASRSPSGLIPDVTTDNVDELVEMAADDPDLSLELLKKIAEAVEGATGQDKADLLSAAVEAAGNAVGLGQTIIEVAGDIASIGDNPKKVAIDAINSMPNLEETGEALYNLLGSLDNLTDFTDNASSEDIAMAAVLLLVGEAKAKENEYSNGAEGYVMGFPGTSGDAGDMAQDLIKELIDNDRIKELPETLQNILEGLGFWT